MFEHSLCVVYRERKSWIFGLILEEQGKKYFVLSEKKNLVYVSKEKIEFTLSLKEPIEGQNYEKAKKLQEIRKFFEKKSLQLPISDLYDLLKEEVTIERSTLVELCFSENFDSNPPVEKELLLALAVEKEPLYFKAKGNLYYPQPHSQVQKVLEHRRKIEENQKKKQSEEESACEWLLHFLSTNSKHQEQDRKELGFEKNIEENIKIKRTKQSPPLIVQKLLEPLKNWILFPSDSQKKKEALDCLALLRKRNIDLSLSIESLVFFLKGLRILEKEEDIFLDRWNISKNHSQKLIESVQKLSCLFKEREDLSSLYTITIDEEGALDLDDALSIEFLKGGEYRVGIHITDVSAWIEKGSQLDEEALKRSQTLYLPMENLPIFPRKLSEEQMSLHAGGKKPAISFLFHLDSRLQTKDSQILASWIQIDENLTYEKVQLIAEVEADETRLSKTCHTLYKIASLWESNRELQGAFQFNKPEIRFYYGERGEICLRKLPYNFKSQKIVRECMIYVNYYTACLCRDENIPAIYIVQEPAQSDVVVDSSFSRGLAKNFSRSLLLDWFSKLKPSEMSWLVQRHFSLGLEAYTQVTSPIRRYQDLVIHRQILSFILGQPTPYSLDEMTRVISILESKNRILKEVEQQSFRFWSLKYLKQEQSRKFRVRARVLKELKPFHYLVEIDESLLRNELLSNRILNRDEEIEVLVESVNPILDRLVLRAL